MASLRHGRHGYARGRAGRAAWGSDDSGVEKGKPGVTAGRAGGQTDGQTERQTAPPSARIIAGHRQGAGSRDNGGWCVKGRVWCMRQR